MPNLTTPVQGWYGNFTALCALAPIPACNLLSADDTSACVLINQPFKDAASIVVSTLGIAIIIRLIWRSHRYSAAVARTEMGMLLFVYCIILLLQVFTIGGLVSRSKIFLMWTSAIHMALTTCFFWLLLYNAFALYQIVDDGDRNVVYFLIVTCAALIMVVIVVSMKLALDPSKQQQGYSSALFFFAFVFPLVTVMLYLILIFILVYRSLDEHRPLAWVALALLFFASSQLMTFAASAKLCNATHGHINGSMFSILFDIAAVSSIYKFWNTVTDDTWGDCVF